MDSSRMFYYKIFERDTEGKLAHKPRLRARFVETKTFEQYVRY